jgi:rhamnose transport system permease protein
LAPDLNPTLAESTTADRPAAGDGEGSPTGGWRERLRPFLRWETGLALVFIAVVIAGTVASSSYLTQGNFFFICLSIGEVAIMTLPMTLIVITGEIDLSVASTLGLASALLGYLWSHGWSMPLAIVTVLAVGAAAGAFNGLLITRFGLPSLAVTIGTLTLYRGLAIVILGPLTISNFSAAYTNIGINPLPHTGFLSYSVGVFLVLAVIFGLVLHMTPFGRTLYAMGLNKEAALYSGIRVKRSKTLLFIVSGVLSAGAGILLTFRLATAVQDNGLGLELSVVAIVLLGGVSIFGGRGTIAGVVLAVFTFAALQSALFLTTFPQRAIGAVTGGLLLVSVLVPNIPSFVRRGREAVRRHSQRRAAAEGSV